MPIFTFRYFSSSEGSPNSGFVVAPGTVFVGFFGPGEGNFTFTWAAVGGGGIPGKPELVSAA